TSPAGRAEGNFLPSHTGSWWRRRRPAWCPTRPAGWPSSPADPAPPSRWLCRCGLRTPSGVFSRPVSSLCLGGLAAQLQILVLANRGPGAHRVVIGGGIPQFVHDGLVQIAHI